MDFNPHKPIYLQIADTLCEKVLSGEWQEGERIPSVRELGTSLGVNPNTIVRVYDQLQNRQIIYNKRGIGYFVNENAKKEILRMQKEEFLKNELPAVIRKIKLLEIPLEKIAEIYREIP